MGLGKFHSGLRVRRLKAPLALATAPFAWFPSVFYYSIYLQVIHLLQNISALGRYKYQST
jgi:hypothetical protein